MCLLTIFFILLNRFLIYLPYTATVARPIALFTKGMLMVRQK